MLIAILIGKTEFSKNKYISRAYIGMLVVDKNYRGNKYGTILVQRFIDEIKTNINIKEIVIDTECENIAALKLYECKIISIRFY